MLEKLFSLSKHKTTPKREILTGITTFMTMAYILAVNPSILSNTGMDKDALFTATALAAVIGTLLLAIKIKGAFLIGILITTVVVIPAGITNMPDTNLVSTPPSLHPIFFTFDFSQVFTFDMLIVLF